MEKHRQTETTTRIWKSAVDPKTGRRYYYDAITRETQWAKVRIEDIFS